MLNKNFYRLFVLKKSLQLLESFTNEFEYTRVGNTIYVHINGEELGPLSEVGYVKTYDSNLSNSRVVDYIEVKPKFRGKGLYKKLLFKVFEFYKISELISEHRVPSTNYLYQKWTGDSKLGRYDEVIITLNNGNLNFQKK